MIHPDFSRAIDSVRQRMINTSQIVRTEKWQGIPLEHDMREALNVYFQAFMTNDITKLIEDIKPNLPWADLHFEERISGIPSNPGESYKVWPFYGRDKEMRNANERFTHTYMERFWPKIAGRLDEYNKAMAFEPNMGIRYEYGDLNDVKYLLASEPLTRQAYLPIFFPEDTGAKHGGRIPCTLGYHFIRRDNYLHIKYYIRSCDYLRHFRDDIYMAVKLVIWLIEQLQKYGPSNGKWDNVKPGIFTMDITSLHIFHNEIGLLEKQRR